MAIAERYGLSQDDTERIRLFHQDQPVDIGWIVALASTLEPGKPLKLSMDIGATDGFHDAIGDDLFHAAIEDEEAEPPAYHFHVGHNPSVEDEDNLLKTDHGEKEGMDHGEKEGMDPRLLRAMAEHAKVKAQATKQEAKKLACCAKEEAKAAKHALMAAKKAEKAAAKAELVAKKQAVKAQALAKKQAKQQAKKEAKAAKEAEKPMVEVTPGKLVNWFTKDSPATTGELIVLPCGRLCFHADSHPGNLRVSETLDIQKNGGRGPWAQFEAVPDKEKPSVFRLLSHQHRDSECYLGVDQVDDWAGNSDASLWTFGGMPYEFVLVPPDSQAGLWSFYPEGHHTPIEIAPPTPLPEARDVYNAIQEYICMLAESTKIPISMGDAPDNEAHLAEMLNSLHEELPHGLKRIAMKKLGLRQFEVPLDDPESPEWSEDWDLIVQDLHDMGFESKEQNVKAVASAGGDLKQAVKMLRMQEKAKPAHLATPYYE